MLGLGIEPDVVTALGAGSDPRNPCAASTLLSLMLGAGLSTLLANVLGGSFGWAPASLRDAAVLAVVCVCVSRGAHSACSGRGEHSGRKHCSLMETSTVSEWYMSC